MKFNPTWLYRSTLRKLLLFISLLLVASSVGFYFLELRPEKVDFFSALWWTVVTLTTVGYGDLVPHTTPGRVLGILVMASGIGLVSTLTGNLASLIVERHAKQRKGLLRVKLSQHIVLVGWNSYGPTLVRTLAQSMGPRANLVIVSELSETAREDLAYRLELGDRLHFVFGPPAQENVLHRAMPETARLVYILAQDAMPAKDADQQSLYAALTLRSLAPKVPIYAEVVLSDNREHLLRAGVNETIIQDEVTSLLLGLMGTNPSVWPFFQTLVGVGGERCLDYRHLSADERQMRWKAFVDACISGTGIMPLALCHASKELSLQDMLDEGSALDQFILELFTASGQQTNLGQQGPSIVVNPPAEQAMDTFDGVLFLKPSAACRK
jgi:voltage-gated potassium channel